MKPHRVLVSVAVAATLLALASTAGATPPDEARAARGRKAYDRYCISCHGPEGDGRGPTSEWIDPMPRDFTQGTFKFRSTPSGTLPTDEDLHRTITNGLHRTFMPRWAPLTELERRDLVQVVKKFAPRFSTEAQGTPIVIPAHPPFDAGLVKKGKEVWDRVQCATCHGDTGKGNGPAAPTLVDDWGHKIEPRDFTRGSLKIGDTPEDLFRTFMTGLNGTPMPSFADSISADDAWALVAYVRSLRRD